tara:strand:- start:504 stop:1364 length:861 start_codon:yes stop_codon:yes gene_type:complete
MSDFRSRLSRTSIEDLSSFSLIPVIIHNIAMSFIKLGGTNIPYDIYINNPWPKSKEELHRRLHPLLLTSRGIRSVLNSNSDKNDLEKESFYRLLQRLLMHEIANNLFKTPEEKTVAASNILDSDMQEIQSDKRLNKTFKSRYGQDLSLIHTEELQDNLLKHCMNIAHMRAGITKKDLSEMNAMETWITAVYVLQGVETWAKEHFKCGKSMIKKIRTDSVKGYLYWLTFDNDFPEVQNVFIKFLLQKEKEYDLKLYGVPEAWTFYRDNSMYQLFSHLNGFNHPIGAW